MTMLREVTDVVSEVDLSTGAYKRGAFEEALAQAVHQAHKRREPLCVIWVDVDDLQEHNDVYGRERLDAALSSIAQVISSEVDGRGPIGRVGGDAFAIVLAGMDAEAGRLLAERIRRSTSSRLVPLAPEVRVTVSAGVAQMRVGEPCGNLLDAAEDACTHAKQRGRNAVACR